MKILITGSTASQTSQFGSTFSAYLKDALTSQGHEVHFIEKPTLGLSMEKLDKYDKVLLGIAPPTSVTAYKVYPAFAIGYRAWKLGNLEMFIDAPEPHKLQASINSCRSGVSDLTKDFYSRRKSYSDFTSENKYQNEVIGFIEFLFSRTWPKTYYPAFPWCSIDQYQRSLLRWDSLFPVEVDDWILRNTETHQVTQQNKDYWTADVPNSVWVKKLQKNLSADIEPLTQKRLEHQSEVLQRVAGSIGSLVSVYRQGQPWWSPLLAQSLQQRVPVVTDWRHTSFMGSSWTYLASSIEEMGVQERIELADFQKESYKRHIMSFEESSERLSGAVKGQIVRSDSFTFSS
jgi:hypothetical protein